MIYNIKFSEENIAKVNMKYKLKIDNIYIKGSKDEYISIKDLNVESIIVPKNSINVYTLEWAWENDDKIDTKIGISQENEYYTFRLEIVSNIYDKGVKTR